MLDLITTLFTQLVKSLWDEGPTGIAAAFAIVGWGAAAYVWMKNRVGKPKKTEPTTIDYVNDIKKLHDKYAASLNELNEKYNEVIQDLNEKRIYDYKEISKDYNQLASDTLKTLDRLIGQLSSRKVDLSSFNTGEDNGNEPD